ncbi:MAG: NUDIX domain-containing protein [Candidatus Nanohalobium sp.]
MVDKTFTAVKAFVENSEGEVLILRESSNYDEGDNAGKWDVPGGRIEAGERFDESLKREIKEEAGLEAEIEKPFHADEWRPEVNGEKWQITGTYFTAEAKTSDVELSEDHEEYAWIDPENFSDYKLIGGLEKAFRKYLEERKNFRTAGKAVIVNEKGLILVIKRAGDETHLENLWDVPGGRFNYGETPQEGLKREVREEAGLEIEVLEPIKSWTFMRDSGEQVFGTTFLCEPEGFEIELGDEHTDFQWVEKEELDRIEMHDDLREGLKLAHEEWTENQELPKLVRDRIPEIIEENGQEGEIRRVEGLELEEFLRKKVVEEAEEFAENGEKEELADLLEVIDAYIEEEDFSREEINYLREEKNRERGGFSEGFVLEDVK